MIRITLFAGSVLLFCQAALAAEVGGNVAVSLAALVGEHSPLLSQRDRALLDAYLKGGTHAWFPSGQNVIVKADEVTCRISDVDITGKDCTLKFGARTISLAGRPAEAVYATLVWAGVPSSGAAGSIYEGVKSLDCTIHSDEVRQESGGGATCAFTVNQ
jgi:hypothetical protein